MKKTMLLLLVSVLCLGAAVMAADDGAQTLVDINRASIEELTKLPGIGETVAERIVAYREANGPFEKKEELMNVRGIGEKTFLKLEPMIQVVAPSSKE